MSEPKRPGLLRKEVVGWCAFDFANSSYTTLIVTVAYSVYFREAVVGAGNRLGDWYWGLSGILVNLLVIVSSPVLGAVADFSGRKKRFLLLTVIQTVAATAALAWVGPGDIASGMALFVIASIGFEGGYIFYNAFLPDISDGRTAGRISAMAWGTGFAGGLISVAACLPLISRALTAPDGGLDPAAVSGYQLSFVVVAGFFALFSVPTFLWLREAPAQGSLARWTDYVSVGFGRVAETLSHLRRFRETAKFVIAYVFFFGGVNVVIKFSAIFVAQSFGVKGASLAMLFIVTNLIALVGTLAAGWLADTIGQKTALLLTLALWIGVTLVGAFGESRTALWLMAGGAAVGMGSTQSIARALMSRFAPPARETEFFGFYVLAGQVGSILAFLVFGLVSSASGDQRLAILWTVPFFVLGFLTLAMVDAARGEREARTLS
jgi:UMF1 family MFS transporter